MVTVHSHTDVAGSLLRPPELLDAQERHARGDVTEAAFKGVEECAVDDALRLQEECGRDIVSGGEMRLVSVNIGREQALAHAKASGKTGIFKRPVRTSVAVTATGLQGDTISDIENHGGVDQAVYVYGVPDYQWWSQELGYDLAPGSFGENLTVTHLVSAGLSVGDRLHFGQVVLEVTAPRIPCVTLARRMDDSAFLKRFRAAERPGVYCRVVCGGTIQVGDTVRYEPYVGETVTVRTLFRDFFAPTQDALELRRQLAAPLAIRARAMKEQQLATLLVRRKT